MNRFCGAYRDGRRLGTAIACSRQSERAGMGARHTSERNNLKHRFEKTCRRGGPFFRHPKEHGVIFQTVFSSANGCVRSSKKLFDIKQLFELSVGQFRLRLRFPFRTGKAGAGGKVDSCCPPGCSCFVCGPGSPLNSELSGCPAFARETTPRSPFP